MALSRDEAQALIDQRAAAVLKHKRKRPYTIADRLEEQVAKYGERPFVLYGDLTLTYAEVNARANQVAHAANVLGLRKGDVCAIAMENRPEFFDVFLGLMKIGVTVSLINTNITGSLLRHSLGATGAKVAIVGEECLNNFDHPEVRDLVPLWRVVDEEKTADERLRALCAADLGALALAAPQTDPDRRYRDGLVGESVALHIFTSGTTGLPKAAITSHMRWLSVGDAMSVGAGTSEESVFYCFLPLYHGAAVMSLLSHALRVGGAVAVRRKFSTSQFWNDVRRHRVTVAQYIGEVCRYLLNTPESPDDRDHTLSLMIGAGLTPDVWRRFKARFGVKRIMEGWGATESNCSISSVDEKVGSCGRIPYWEKSTVRIVRYDVETETHPRDAHGRMIVCEPGEVGEGIGMLVEHPEIGAGRFEGYTCPQATERKILRNVFREGDAWWSSGDLLRYDEDGYVYFVDRIGDTFRWKSENVSTTEVAEVLSGYPGLEIVTIYGVAVPGHEGRAGMAAVVMQPDHAFDPAAFYRLATEQLPEYARPLFVRVAPQADMTTTFKLRRIDLQRQGYDPRLVADPLYVRDDAGRTYAPYSQAALERLGIPPA